MKKDIFTQILSFKENHDAYTPEERKKIVNTLQKQLKRRLKTINNIIMGSIDDING